VLKKAFIQKAIAFLDSELELLNLKIRHPEQFQPSNPKTCKSELYIVPKSKGLGIIGMAEIVAGLHLSGEITGSDGKPVPLIQIANTFEQAFNFSFGNIYDKLDTIFNRKPYNLSKALDILRSAIVREDRKRNNR
jgi:hypothetical protein